MTEPSSRCDPSFEPLLEGFDREALDAHPGSVFGLSSDRRIAYVNAAWSRFAEENEGQPGIQHAWDLGASYLDAVAEPLRSFYEDLLRRAVEAGAASMHPAACDYECSSAETFRMYHMDVYALHGGRGYLLVNSLVVEEPHDPAKRAPHDPDRDAYTDPDGLIHQCSHCRRVENLRVQDRWDWVPDWVDEPPEETSHTVCTVCFEYFYPES